MPPRQRDLRELSPGPGARAWDALLADPSLADDVVGKAADAPLAIVRRARGVLEAARARAALLDDATRSNAEIARAEGVTTAQVADVRRRLVSLGVLPPLREPRRAFPQLPPMPRAPRVLEQGLCVGHPGADLWTSDDRGRRELARRICDGCHVKATCRDWALRAIPAADTAIYGGTTAAARRRLRRQLGIVPPRGGMAAVNARKTACPECLLPLSGENLITEPGRRPGTVRRRCRACTRRRKAEAYQRRRAAAQEAAG